MTTEAMKQAQHLLRWTHFGECRTYPGPVPEAQEVDKLLSEAIATEEAQGVEPVAWLYIHPVSKMKLVSTGNEFDLDKTGIPLFTRPSPPPAIHKFLAGKLELMTAERDKMQLELGDLRALRAARPAPPSDHIGDATKLVRERAALIDSHKFVAENGVNQAMRDLARNTADMLAADAQEIERKYISPVRTVADLANNLLLMDQTMPIYGAQYIDHPTRGRCAIAVSPTVTRERVQDSRWIGQGNELNAAIVWTMAAQQVAVPQVDAVGAALDLEARAKTVESQTTERAMLHAANCLRMLASAPRPPNGACDSPDLCKLNGECAGQYGTKQKCTAAPQPPQADRVPMTPEQISDTHQKATGQHLRPCDKHAVEALTREIEAHHKIGVKE